MTENAVRAVSTQTNRQVGVSHHHVSLPATPPTGLRRALPTRPAYATAGGLRLGESLQVTQSYDSWKTARMSPELEPMAVAPTYNSPDAVSLTYKHIVRRM